MKNGDKFPLNKKINRETYVRRIADGWTLISSENLSCSGAEISSLDLNLDGGFPARVPSTVWGTLIQNGVYDKPFMGTKLKDIPREPFTYNWWYRTVFSLSETEAQDQVVLSFDGINYQANIWLNGKLIADHKLVNGPYRRFQIDISNNVLSGDNVLAVEVIPPQRGQFAIGFVDWNPAPPDKNMGIFRPVSLHFFKQVRIGNPYVQSEFKSKDFRQADLHVSAELTNFSNHAVSGIISGRIGSVHFEQPVTLAPGTQQTIRFSPDSFSQLSINNPRLWWPIHFGKPELYTLDLQFISDDKICHEYQQVFGIRSVEDYLNAGGHRGFMINGKHILIKGGGWTDDIALADTSQSLEAQIAYVKHMNLNCIRLEGFWGNDQTIYDICDREGILIMAGWSCHWEHELHLGKAVDPRYGGITEPDDIDLIARSWEDQILWLRNHPSIFVWSAGSDMVPHPDLERRYFQTFEKYDPTRPYLNSTGGVGSDQKIITKTEIISDISGSSGVKMLGPYDHTPPNYWYTNKHLGGAYGFNTETCPGANVPPLASIKAMIPREHLWPVDQVWDYHCALYEFGTLNRFREAIDKRFGKAENLEDFLKKAQVMNYELMRPMFESFQANKGEATGIIQWMLNSAWPAMYWQLYDYYLRPNGAFYGTKKACEPLHLLYDYGDHSIRMINDTLAAVKGLKAIVRCFNLQSKEVWRQEIDIDIPAESAAKVTTIPQLPDITTIYFVDLRLHNREGTEIGNNFYWLSTEMDELDYDFKFEDFTFYTPTKKFADLRGLASLPLVNLKTTYGFTQDGDKQVLDLTVANPSDTIAFFIDMELIGKKSRQSILPVLWDDNYITLIPGESRHIRATFAASLLDGDEAELQINGWNLSG